MTADEAVDSGTAGPGAALRLAREGLGLSQPQAAEQLTLDVSVIEALERDDFAALGAAVFVKGHLRRYAALLGLAEDEMLGAYEHSRLHLDPPSLIPRARSEMLPARSESRWPWIIGGTVLVLVAAAAVAYLSENGLQLPWRADGGQAPVTAQDVESGTVPPPVPGDALDAGSAPAAESPVSGATGGGAMPGAAGTAGTEAAAATPVVLPPGHVSLDIDFAADSWTEIYDGSGKAVLYDLGKAGTRRTVAAVAPLSVTFGNAPAVSLEVNGRSVRLPALPAGQTVARFGVDASGALR